MKQVKPLTVTLAAALLLNACVTTRQVWTRDGVPADQLNRDNAECAYNAELACGNQYELSELAARNRKIHFDNLHKTCMVARGYLQRTIQE